MIVFNLQNLKNFLSVLSQELSLCPPLIQSFLNSLFELEYDDSYLESLYRISEIEKRTIYQEGFHQLDPQNAFPWLTLLLSHPNPKLLNSLIKFKPTVETEKFEFRFPSDQIENHQMITDICSYPPKLLEKDNLQHYLKMMFFFNYHTGALIRLFSKMDSVKKQHLQALNLLREYGFLFNKNINFVLNYHIPVSIYHIILSMMSHTPYPNYQLTVVLEKINNLSEKHDFQNTLNIGDSAFFPQAVQSLNLADMLNLKTLKTLVYINQATNRLIIQKEVFLTYQINQSQIRMKTFGYLVRLHCSSFTEFKKMSLQERKGFLNLLYHLSVKYPCELLSILNLIESIHADIQTLIFNLRIKELESAYGKGIEKMLVGSQYPLIFNDVLKAFGKYPEIFQWKNLLLWSHHPHLKKFCALFQFESHFTNTKNKIVFLHWIAKLNPQANIPLLFEILNSPNFNFNFDELDLFLEKLIEHPHLDLILELTEKGILKKSFLDHKKISLFLEILDSKHFKSLYSISCTLSQYSSQMSVRQFIHYAQIEKIEKLLPYILDASPELPLNEILPHRLDNMLDFVARYRTLSIKLILQLNSSIFDYQYTQQVIKKLVQSGYLLEDDHQTHFQVYLKTNQICFERLIQQWNELNIFNANEKTEVFKLVAHHPKTNEFEHVFVEKIYSKTFYLLLIHSPAPFEAFYLCQQLMYANLLPHIRLSLLKDFFKYPQNLSILGQHLSLYIPNYRKREPKVSIRLLYYVFVANSPHRFHDTFEALSQFHTEISVELILQFISHVDKKNQLLKLKQLLDILQTHEIVNLAFMNPLYEQSTDWLIYVSDVLELLTQHQMMSQENLNALLYSTKLKYRSLYLIQVSKILPLKQELFESILQEEQPKEIARFIGISIHLKTFNIELFNELMTYKIILFASPTVCERFLNIPFSQFLSLNLYQLLKIAQRYQNDLQQASEALLVYCSNLSIALNDSQITHTQSIHQSASESAEKLWLKYHKKITPITPVYQLLISLLHEYIPATELFIAEECIQKIHSTEFGLVKDPVSKVSLKNLLALCIEAIRDESCLVDTISMADRVRAIHRGLSDIQIGTPLDHGDPICPGGAFNKLIEVMTGIHVDCKQIMITQQMAGIKLVRLMIHHTRRYLTQSDSAFSRLKAQEKIAILEKLLTEGIHVIYHEIIPIFADELIEEFKSIFKSKEHYLWETFIESAQYVNINELNPIIEILINKLDEEINTNSTHTPVFLGLS